MYSYEDRIKAVELYIKYDYSLADTVRELGYPTRHMLSRWYQEYKEYGELHKKYIKQSNFSEEQKKAVVDYYLEHGRSITRTVRAMGYGIMGSVSKCRLGRRVLWNIGKLLVW